MPRPRSKRAALVHLLESCPLPVYLIDDQRRIIYCNHACQDWMGSENDELIGARCDYHSDASMIASGTTAPALCPPPGAFAGRVVACSISNSKSESTAPALFVPLGNDATAVAGVIAIVGAAISDDGPIGFVHQSQEALHLHGRVQAHRRHMSSRYALDCLIGDDPWMRRVRSQVEVAMTSIAPVVIVGPKGSGREHVGRTIHYGHSTQNADTLIPIDCSLLDARTIESTIQEIVRDWSDAASEASAVLLLTDVDQLPFDAQTILLGFLEIEQFPLRTICTSSSSLLLLSETERFHRELALMLSTFVIELPKLSDREQDIPLLAQWFLESFNTGGDRQLGGFTGEAMDQLVCYPWPGNVRELIEVVEHCHRNSEGPVVTEAELPEQFTLIKDALAHPRKARSRIDLDQFLREVESELLIRALEQAKGNKSQAARLLSISRPRLLRRISQLGLTLDRD